MADVYLTVAEIYQMQHSLVDNFGGLRSPPAAEAAIFIGASAARL